MSHHTIFAPGSSLALLGCANSGVTICTLLSRQGGGGRATAGLGRRNGAARGSGAAGGLALALALAASAAVLACRCLRVLMRSFSRWPEPSEAKTSGMSASASAGEELCRWRMNDEEDVSKCEIRAAW